MQPAAQMSAFSLYGSLWTSSGLGERVREREREMKLCGVCGVGGVYVCEGG